MSDEQQPKGVVAKNKTAQEGRFSYKYASLADTIRQVEESYGYQVEQTVRSSEQGNVVVTRYREKAGEGEWSEWLAPVPVLTGSGGNNPMQAFGSALTYARRYSLQCALCMAADDTDGVVQRVPQPVSDAQVAEINRLFQAVGVTDQNAARDVFLAALAGNEVHGSRDLNDVQAGKVIDLLKRIQVRKGQSHE